MSKTTAADIESCICGRPGCWRTRIFREAGVVADLGGPWRLFLLDHHFQECVSSASRVGGICDLVAVYPQDSNDKLKLVELKSNLGKLPQAKTQFIKGGELMRRMLPTGFQGLKVEAELHVRFAPTTTRKTRDAIKIDGRLIPIRAFRGGKRV
jgi:hypothetical protein